MVTVQTILEQKGREVWMVGSEATVLQAARLMNEHRIGALIVTDGGRICGIFTERDVLRRVVGEQCDPANTTVGQVMTKEVVCCSAATTLDEAGSVMTNRRIRHLPVVNEDGSLLGLVSIGDLNACRQSHQEHTIFLLHEYLYGRV